MDTVLEAGITKEFFALENQTLEEIYKLVFLIFDFIKVGFNRELDIAKGKCRVMPDNNWLLMAVMMRTMFAYPRISLEFIKKVYEVRNYEGKVIDFHKELTEKPTSRWHRKMVAGGKAQHEYPLTGFAVCGYCGSPIVGACLSKRYRYYKCRGTYPTASREKICDAHYIKADWLENAVWENVKRILSNPEVLLNEVRKQTEDEQARVSTGTLEQEIRVKRIYRTGTASYERV